MNYLCLFIWIFELVYGFNKLTNDQYIHPAIFICAVIVCIMHYIGEIANE